MAAKKTPGKKAAPAKKVAAKKAAPAAKATAKTPTPPKRTDRAGSSGMGMTKTAVEQRAKDAALYSMVSDVVGGSIVFDYRPNNRLLENISLENAEGFKKGYEWRAATAANKVRKKYGVALKSSSSLKKK